MTPVKILLTVAYDGTGYCGWQRQQNGLAVQEVLETALGRVVGYELSVAGASRTDAGVHALGQRAVFRASGLRIPLDKLPEVVNTQLPSDITVTAAEPVDSDFNPRHAREKTYEYRFYCGRYNNPLLRNYTCHIPYRLDYAAMETAAAYFVGTYDFAAFCATGGGQKTTVRTVFECGLRHEDALVTLTVRGNAFLYNMVRIIAGTVLYAGLGKLTPGDVPAVIRSGKRAGAGKTLPPEGLLLKEILY